MIQPAYQGNEPYIFISYAHKDKDLVYPFIEELQKQYNVWYDEGIRYGKDFSKEILLHLKKCYIFIYMITPNSLESQYCQNEIYFANEKRINFINIVINSSTILDDEFKFLYGRYQMFFLDRFRCLKDAITDLSNKCEWFNNVKSINGIKRNNQSANMINVFERNNENLLVAKSQFELGKRYFDGKEEKEDLEKAVYWFKKAAELGYADSQLELGKCYEYGHGVEKDYKQAAYWYKKAADQDNSSAQYYLGCLYHFGFGVEKDYKMAIYWFKKAAELGFTMAQYYLGLCYEQGLGVEQNNKLSFYWYKKSAEQGYFISQYILGLFYENGTGVEKDYKQAVYWYKKAADQGDPRAKEALQKDLFKRYI